MAYTLLIDGRSGSGKTTLAQQIAAATGMSIVHLDDFYPGWYGLREGAQMVARDVLHPTQPGYWRWDWHAHRAAHWVALDPAADLIIEGVGAVTRASLRAARRRGKVDVIRVELADAVRKERALRRDAGYAPFWHMWSVQEERLEAEQALEWERVADVIIRRG